MLVFSFHSANTATPSYTHVQTFVPCSSTNKRAIESCAELITSEFLVNGTKVLVRLNLCDSYRASVFCEKLRIFGFPIKAKRLLKAFHTTFYALLNILIIARALLLGCFVKNPPPIPL